jgi:hypothetical protein
MKVATILTSGLSNTTFYRRNIYFVAPPLSIPGNSKARTSDKRTSLFSKPLNCYSKKSFVSPAHDVAL